MAPTLPWALRPAVEQARAIVARRVTSAELVEAHIDRIERLDGNGRGGVNAVVLRCFGEARERARAADAALARGEVWGPLHGVPITVKESFMVRRMRATSAIPGLEDYVADSNALNVQRLLDAGAVLLGKTNVPVWTADYQSFNPIYGKTSNPWDLSRTCGGSSGGSAVSLACGFAALELGSDIGGSIRIPAHFCGVSGHKPSYGLGHLHGHIPGINHRSLQPMRTLRGQKLRARLDPSFHHGLAVSGPMARCCADLELAMRLLARPEPVMEAGGWSFTLPPARCTDVRALRVAAWLDDARFPTDRDYLRLLEAAVEALEREGATVDRSARPFSDKALAEHLVTFVDLMKASGGEAFGGGSVQLAEDVSNQIKRNFVKERYEEFFQMYDVMLCPVFPIPAFPHSTLHVAERVFSGKGIPDYNWVGNALWPGIVIMADLPSTVVPVGRTPAGLPCGVQIVSANFQDLTCIEVGKMLERFHPPSRYEPPPGFGPESSPASKL